MIDKSKCYEILGVTAGVSRQELKAAHRDLAKVWHPDRFAHDPRLQAKAQEKLKEINDAFDQLTSKARHRSVTPPPNGEGSDSYYQRRKNRKSSGVGVPQPAHWRLVFVAVLVFGVAFFFTWRSLIRRNQQQDQDSASSIEQIPALEIDTGQQSSNRGGWNELSRGKSRHNEQGAPEDSVARQTIVADAAPVQPLATVTVTIDQATGMLARRNCPTKKTMTYPRGNEPHQYCNVHLPHEPAPAEGELRIKSAAKRLVSPGKWFEGKEKPDVGSKQDVKSP